MTQGHGVHENDRHIIWWEEHCQKKFPVSTRACHSGFPATETTVAD